MQPGTNVGQYTLMRYLGKGGMAEVWEARHQYLNKGRLAIKFLLPQFATNFELQERFLREAQRQLEHPTIISAVDFFQIEGLSYMVMRYVPPPSLDGRPEGADEKPKSLEDRLEEHRPLSIEELHSISSDILDALEFAHAQGVVHRDVKPANVLLHRDGRALLTDFGIAKGLRDERSMTRIGTSIGTPDYMSPEQIRTPQNVDVRSDIYSFGCVLYAMLSRNPPFGAEETTDYEIHHRHVNETPPPLVYWNRDVPPEVGEVVFKCLEKDPAKRFQNCDQVDAALEAALAPPKPQPAFRPPNLRGNQNHKLTAPVQESNQTVATPPPAPTQRRPTTYELPQTTIPPAIKAEVPRGETPFVPVKAVTPPAPAPVNASSSARYLVFGLIGIVLIAASIFAWHTWGTRKSNTAVSTDWSKLPYGDARLSDCKGQADCTVRKAQADKLLRTDWAMVPYDSPLLDDCMNLPKCIDRKRQSDTLKATAEAAWPHADRTLLSDCMRYPQCSQERIRREKSGTRTGISVAATSGPSVVRGVDPEDLPSCCNDSSNPALCKKLKAKAGIHGDCVLGH